EVEAGVDPLFGSVPEFDPEPLPDAPAIPEFTERRFESMPEIEVALGIEPGSERSTVKADSSLDIDSVPDFGAAFDRDFDREFEDFNSESGDTRLLEPMPAEGEIKVTATTEVGATLREDWLSSTRAGETMDFPAHGHDGLDDHRREPDHGPLNRRFFPDPGTTEWSVSELQYRQRRNR
ncbi:MAG: hypothetical protein M3Y45_07440, partial [Actinomycetota bacterium]|nr:hypothetical protein [Actinomycetota bacterium]